VRLVLLLFLVGCASRHVVVAPDEATRRNTGWRVLREPAPPRSASLDAAAARVVAGERLRVLVSAPTLAEATERAGRVRAYLVKRGAPVERLVVQATTGPGVAMELGFSAP
jgi:hypothetical protein